MIEYLLFDLDNTLYPESSAMGPELTRRMNLYVAEYLGVSVEEAKRLRRSDMRTYGTTMRWLIQRHGLTDINDYIDKIHPEDVTQLVTASAELPRILDSIKIPKSILTNSPAAHAHRVLRHLGVEDRFEHVFDLSYSNYQGKPHKETYEQVLSAIGHPAPEVLFIDDIPDYLRPFDELGGKIVLVDEMGKRSSELEGRPSIRSLAELPALLATI